MEDKYTERQKQAFVFFENVIGRLFQEHLDAADIVMVFMRIMDVQLRKLGLTMYIGPYHKEK